MSGKGSTPRPLSVTPQEYEDNFARTFSRIVDVDDMGCDLREKVCPPMHDPAERLRRANLERAQHVILGTPCGDWPASDPINHPDQEN